MTHEPPTGTIVLVDKREPCYVEGGSRYVGGYPNRLPGMKVRPVGGGRARVVALRRLTQARCPGCAVVLSDDADHFIDCPYQGRNAPDAAMLRAMAAG